MRRSTRTLLAQAGLCALGLWLGGTSAQAGTVTCKTFGDRFASRLRASRPPLAPLEWSPGKLTETVPHIAHTLTGPDGVTGNAECFDHDALGEVDLYLDLKNVSPTDTAAHMVRFRTIAAAALCATAVPNCAGVAADLFGRMTASLRRAARQGDPIPSADETVTLPDRTDIEVAARPGTVQFTVFLRQPSGGS